MKISLNNPKTIIAILTFIIGIALISIGLITKILNKPTLEPEKTSDSELLGGDRVKVQDEIIKIIEKYLTDETKIKEYLDKKATKSISIRELNEELNIDISEFLNLKYNCNPDFTIIDFNEDYSTHLINITCDALLKK